MMMNQANFLAQKKAACWLAITVLTGAPLLLQSTVAQFFTFFLKTMPFQAK